MWFTDYKKFELLSTKPLVLTFINFGLVATKILFVKSELSFESLEFLLSLAQVPLNS